MYEINVDGMTCQGCVNSVTKAILAIDKSAKVDVDLKSKKVKVQTKLTKDKVEAAIDSAGFDVVK